MTCRSLVLRLLPRLLSRLLCALLLPALAHAAFAAAPVRAERLLPDERLPLDGTLAHPAWQRAVPHAEFVEKDPVVGAAPREATRVRVLFDEQAIWVGIEADDGAPAQIRDDRCATTASTARRTSSSSTSTPSARSAAQFFRVNAAGSPPTACTPRPTTARTSRPTSTGTPPSRATRRLDGGAAHPVCQPALCRGPAGLAHHGRARLPRQQFHLFTSVLIPREAPSFIATLQPLQGVQLPAQHARFLTLRPSLTLRRAEGARPAAARRAAAETDASLDVKWRPRAELVVDGTLNPDFSQVALDVPQLPANRASRSS
jgi:hypothetical protein